MVSLWTLKVPNLGKIQFRRFRGGTIGQKVYVTPEKPKTTYLCPTHKVAIKGKVYYVCPEGGERYERGQLLREVTYPSGQTKRMTSEELREKNKRTEQVKVKCLVKREKISPDMLSTNLAYYLVPHNTYENVMEYNQLVDLLLNEDMVGITGKFRLRTGSFTTHNFVIFASIRKKCLLAIEFVPEKQTREIPDEAKFKKRFLTPEMQEENVRAKNELLKPQVCVR